MNNNKFEIYASGLCCMSVCVDKDLSVGEIEARANAASPTGISSRWTKAIDSFGDGYSNPHICEDNPNKLHYLLTC